MCSAKPDGRDHNFHQAVAAARVALLPRQAAHAARLDSQALGKQPTSRIQPPAASLHLDWAAGFPASPIVFCSTR